VTVAPFPYDHPIKPGDEGGPLPPIVTYQGRDVRWTEWEETLPVTHYQAACETCGHDQGHEWMAWGVVFPRPGETTTEPEVVRARRSKRPYVRDVTHHAHPIRRLVAFRCPPCRTLRVYDRGDNGHTFVQLDVDTPSLFADFELGEGQYHWPDRR
jgi:hypothetical protein